jgi:hypothetical protein
MATAKVLLVDGKHTLNRMEALFNPQQLGLGIRAQAGRLHPIGWSHPIKQYAYTEEVGFPLDFLFTKIAMTGRRGGMGRKIKSPAETNAPQVNIVDPAAWLTSFCYAPAIGRAPHPLLVVWPHVLTMMTTVDTANEMYRRFAPDLSAMEVMVRLKFSEIRVGFKTSYMQWDGWSSFRDEHSDALGGVGLQLTGPSRTRMGGAGR